MAASSTASAAEESAERGDHAFGRDLIIELVLHRQRLEHGNRRVEARDLAANRLSQILPAVQRCERTV